MGDIVLFLMPLWVGKNSHLIYKDLPQGSTVPLLIVGQLHLNSVSEYLFPVSICIQTAIQPFSHSDGVFFYVY